MKIFFDNEFTGLHKSTTLISIGLISEDGKRFYAELSDYDKSQVDDWLQENVINKLWINSDMEVENIDYYHYGDKEYIREKLQEYVSQFDMIEWVSDVCHYDFVLLIDLLYGHALEMPYGKHCSACHDINQDIAREFNISEIEAFDKNREEIVALLDPDWLKNKDESKHNALWDADIIKKIYESFSKKTLIEKMYSANFNSTLSKIINK